MKGYINANTKIKSDNPNNPEIMSPEGISDMISRNFKGYVDDNPEYIASVVNEYSTDERVVGKWIDGKLLYQKTIVISNLTKSTWTSVDFGNNADNIIEFSGGYINSDKRMRPFGTYISSNEYFFIDVLPNRCSYRYNASDSGMMIILTIRYTK